MKKIREGKYAYRQKKSLLVIDEFYDLAPLLNIMNEITQEHYTVTFGGNTVWENEWGVNYWSERLIERSIINREIPDNGFRKMLIDHNYFRRSLTNMLKEKIQLFEN